MRHLPRRILLSAVLSVAVAGGLIAGGVLLGRPMLRDAAVATIASSTSHAACQASPSTWGAQWGGFSLFAYDLDGVSANPDAPPLEADLLRQRRNRQGPVRKELSDDRMVSVLSMAPDGPCAMLRMGSNTPDPKAMRLFLVILTICIVAGMLLAGVWAMVFVVLPFRQRVKRLSEAASGVGRSDFTSVDVGDEALSHIADVLAESHKRIVQNRVALEERNRALEEHLAGIAHDLRTPLASLQLSLEAIADEATDALHGEAHRALTDTVYLSSLVDNLHQGARLRHDFDVTQGRTDLAALVGRLAQRFTILGRHAGVEVGFHAPDASVWVDCTPALAERAIGNLVQNAVQHQDGGGHVAIVLRLDEARRIFSLVVDDDGPGLPEALLASLEVEGLRTDAARQRGPGLGMVITAEVARRAGWNLCWERLEPHGTRARITGPTASALPPRSRSAEPEASRPREIDDDVRLGSD